MAILIMKVQVMVCEKVNQSISLGNRLGEPLDLVINIKCSHYEELLSDANG